MDNIHFTDKEPFKITEDGLYIVSVHGEDYDSSPYDNKRSTTNNGRYTIKVINDEVQVWDNVSEDWLIGEYRDEKQVEAIACMELEPITIDRLEKFLGNKITLWIGPFKYYRNCFKCDKPIVGMRMGDDDEDPNYKYALQSDDAASFDTHGHYGCTVIDSMGDEEINILVCDYCLIKHGDKVLRCDVSVDKDKGWYGRYNFRTIKESMERSDKFCQEEIKLLTSYNYEWRYYTREGKQTTNPIEADHNNSGWFSKDWQWDGKKKFYKDGSGGPVGFQEARYMYLKNKELAEKYHNIRDSIFHPQESRDFLKDQDLKRMMRNLGCKTKEELQATHQEMLESLDKYEKETEQEENK